MNDALYCFRIWHYPVVDADMDLLEQWRAGNKSAGENLFQRHFADVLQFFNHKVWSKAEDLTQQTFLECVRARGRFQGQSSFRTYLFAIAWNQLRHHYRSETKNDHVDFEQSSMQHLVATTTPLSSKIDQVRRGQQLHEALTRLPIAQQALLECHYWQDLDAAALGEIFEVPPGTIRVRLLRARNALRSEIEKLKQASVWLGEDDDPLSASLNQIEPDEEGSRSTG